jgi:hypothetical protein
MPRHLVRNSPLKQKLVLLGPNKQRVDDFPEQGYTSEQVKGMQGKHQRKQLTQGQRNLQQRRHQLIPLQTRRKIVTTKNTSDQLNKSSGREKEKEKKATTV